MQVFRATTVAAFAAILSTSFAWAAVTDEDPVTFLPEDTVLAVKETIAVKPNQSEVQVHPTPAPGSIVDNKTLNLWLHVAASKKDRELVVGTRWKFEKTEYRKDYYGVFLVGKTEGGSELTWQFARHRQMGAPTIGELKTYFGVELPKPEVIPAH